MSHPAKLTEAQVVATAEKQLRHRTVWFVNHHGTVYGGSGVPDILTLDHTGLLVGVECKTPQGTVYPNQLRQLQAILRCGGRAVVYVGDMPLTDILDTPRHVHVHEVGTLAGDSEFIPLPTHLLQRSVELITASHTH